MAGRVAALDGLRGLAALIVVVHHCFLVSPALAEFYRPAEVGPAAADSALSRTPLHLLWAGPQAVWVFFVLSGLVLTLPFLGDRSPTWRAYYPQRLVRLYVPVLGSITLALLLIVLVPREAQDGFSWWINAHDVDYDGSTVLQAGVLVFGATQINNPLWSLQVEVLFSLLLPAYVWVARWARGRPQLSWVLAGGALGSSALATAVGASLAAFLAIFALGSLLAANATGVIAFFARVGGAACWWTTAGALALLTVPFAPWSLPEPVALPLTVAGAALLVALFMGSAPVAGVGVLRPVLWLGSRSFSLYVVHVPVIVAVTFAVGWTNPLICLAVCLPLSLLVAEGFFRVVERPSLRLSRSAGRATGRLTGAATRR